MMDPVFGASGLVHAFSGFSECRLSGGALRSHLASRSPSHLPSHTELTGSLCSYCRLRGVARFAEQINHFSSKLTRVSLT
jgi:hypothetical protein